MMDFNLIEQAITQGEKALERDRGKVQVLAARGTNAEKLAWKAQARAQYYEEASKLFAQFADAREAKVIETIETIVSVGLSQIFNEDIKLKINQVTRARRIEMDIKVVTGGLETSILDARGGGLAAVAGFLLRLTILLLSPGKRKFLAADEPFAQLSEEYLVPTAEFIADICNRADIQIIMVTHQQEFTEVADKVIRIIKNGTNTAKFEVEK